MPAIHPHINFNGNAEAAFTFYQSVFGGSFSSLVRFKDMVGAGFSVADHEAHKIMHIALPIGPQHLLMGNDVPEMLGTVNEREHRSKIVISATSKEEAERLFHGLSAGGSIEMPLDQSPWGAYFGMFRDQFGIEWMVEFEEKKELGFSN